MLDNDAFVFDCVCHVFNFDKRNAFGKPGEMFINQITFTPSIKSCLLLESAYWVPKSSYASGTLMRSHAWSSRSRELT